MIVSYDNVTRAIVGTAETVNVEGLKTVLTQRGVPHLEWQGALPDTIERLWVTPGGGLALREPMPFPVPADLALAAPYTVALPAGAPAGAVCEPAAGTVLGSGLHAVVVRAPGFHDARYAVEVHTPEDEQARLIAIAEDLRWRRETGGTVWDGHPVYTDDRAKTLIMGSVMSAQLDPTYRTTWQFRDGTSQELGAAEIVALGRALGAHVAAAFAVFKDVKSDILNNTITTEEQIEDRFVASD
ncbi:MULTISPECIES: DUF4376 domain-containing protein [Methylobacterium]|jgi:hypothetical protein|uniref:DUF4376 domain-containing protein n=3 Tax=Pseudomonadota TaxID=1224 RepID=A0ABQ4SXR5_9HYPH|nr:MULTISPECIES: DUF4376 domain-containing protein [Methylobacterium]PIU05288.1 MAG: hypothetical protein COT56_15995 [Methylobacterium sp. CG09_land_8_20_14_0_10_71_15]PIU12350.1 MAG: hypothetical protein COT28_15275 [Methylobacterium sp. CG08_land_8_20_14_0_20_71_15]GBU16859.1 hypothetical protein AwMethylo_10740 [Methylobacterium sp.]GJE07994.1 hypothetical protein AOPFMNJM_3326 [Methylobacterium jeotgali]